MIKSIILIVIFWVACGIISAGFMNADARSMFPRTYADPQWAYYGRGDALMISIFGGPFGLLVNWCEHYPPNGWTLTADPVGDEK